MLFLNKLLRGVKNDPTIFKNPKMNFILGLTNAQIKELKRFATTNEFIIQNKQEFFLTEKGDLFLKNNPFESWQNSEFPKRPELNLEYLKEEKSTATVTKAIRNLARHLLDGEALKPNSMEAFIQEELLSENSNFRDLKQELNACLSEGHRINLSQIYQNFISYGLTKSIVSVLLLDVLAKNKDSFAIYEKFQFQLKINQLLFDKIMFCPENFEIQKTVFEQYSILANISGLVLPKRSNNVLDTIKGLIGFINDLDKYAIQTERLSAKTIKFRNTVVNAKDPINLITKDIPRILQGKKLKDCDNDFAYYFEQTLEELKTATDVMVNEIKTFTLKAFHSENRAELSERFKAVEEFIGAKEMKTLYANITNDEVSDRFWIERIATFINQSRVPKDWSDEDVADFKIKIKELALKFYVLEATIGTSQNTITADFNSVLKNFLKLSKPEQFMLLRKVVNG